MFQHSDIGKFAVDTGKTNVSYMVQLTQVFHYQVSEIGTENFVLALMEDAVFYTVYEFIDSACW